MWIRYAEPGVAKRQLAVSGVPRLDLANQLDQPLWHVLDPVQHAHPHLTLRHARVCQACASQADRCGRSVPMRPGRARAPARANATLSAPYPPFAVTVPPPPPRVRPRRRMGRPQRAMSKCTTPSRIRRRSRARVRSTRSWARWNTFSPTRRARSLKTSCCSAVSRWLGTPLVTRAARSPPARRPTGWRPPRWTARGAHRARNPRWRPMRTTLSRFGPCPALWAAAHGPPARSRSAPTRRPSAAAVSWPRSAPILGIQRPRAR